MSDVAVIDRDDQGLTLLERRVLQEIADHGDFKKAAANTGMTPAKIRRMLQTEPQFKEAFDQLFSPDDLKATESELQLAVQDVAEVFNDAKNAELVQSKTVTCPCGCDHTFSVSFKSADWATKLRAAESLAKMTRLWKDQKNIKVEGSVALVNMTPDQYLALQAVRMGRPIPDHVYQSLREFDRDGSLKLPPNPAQPVRNESVDATFRVVEDDNDRN